MTLATILITFSQHMERWSDLWWAKGSINKQNRIRISQIHANVVPVHVTSVYCTKPDSWSELSLLIYYYYITHWHAVVSGKIISSSCICWTGSLKGKDNRNTLNKTTEWQQQWRCEGVFLQYRSILHSQLNFLIRRLCN